MVAITLSPSPRSASRRGALPIVALAAVAAAACTGAVAPKDDPGTAPDHGGSGGAVDPTIGGGGAPVAPRLPAGSVRRLTTAQYRNALQDLLGDVSVFEELEPDTVFDGFASLAAARVTLSARAIEQFEAVATSVGLQAVASDAARARLVTCKPQGVADATCARQFVTGFGRRAWRRPLAPEQVERFANLAITAAQVHGDFWQGIAAAVSGLLQAPQFLYRIEAGTPDPADPARRVLDGYELASRLSFLLTESTPDDKLLDAATGGALSSADGLRAEAERLLATARAGAAARGFFGELLLLGELDKTAKLPEVYPKFSTQLAASMRAETLAAVDDLFNGVRDYRGLVDHRTTYVDFRLAELYGLPKVPGTSFSRVTLPDASQRTGLLGHASFLTLHSHIGSTSPTKRGKFIREQLLCDPVPPPPPDVDTNLPEGEASGRTMRERLASHATVAACANCHKFFDPLGLALETFDGIGAERTTENGALIDASGELDGAPFVNARELAARLAEHPGLGPCLVRKLFGHAVGQPATAEQDALLAELSRSFAARNFGLKPMLVDLVTSEGFRHVAN